MNKHEPVLVSYNKKWIEGADIYPKPYWFGLQFWSPIYEEFIHVDFFPLEESEIKLDAGRFSKFKDDKSSLQTFFSMPLYVQISSLESMVNWFASTLTSNWSLSPVVLSVPTNWGQIRNLPLALWLTFGFENQDELSLFKLTWV